MMRGSESALTWNSEASRDGYKVIGYGKQEWTLEGKRGVSWYLSLPSNIQQRESGADCGGALMTYAPIRVGCPANAATENKRVCSPIAQPITAKQ